jgi:hypothetical protein
MVIGLSGNDADELSYKELDLKDVLTSYGLEAAENLPGVSDAGTRLMQEIDHPRGMLSQRQYRGECSSIACMASRTQLNQFYDLTLRAAGQAGGGGVELGFMIMPLNFGGSYYFEPGFYYDPADAKDREVKRNQFLSVSRSLIHAGAYFPRPYPLWAEQVYFRMGAYHRKIKMVKKLLDPKNIMNPGKLALA